MVEQRKQVRTKLRVAVKVCHAGLGELLLHTSDISDSGVYIFAEGCELPAVGDEVTVEVQGLPGDDAPVVPMRIVRVDAKGMGLEYID